MAILVFAELLNGKLKKTSSEVMAYACALAKNNNEECVAVALGNAELNELEKAGNCGIKKLIHADNEKLNQLASRSYTKVIASAAEKINAHSIILSHNSTGKTIAPRLAVKLKAALLPGVSSLPDADFVMRKTVFSGKAFAYITSNAEKKIITVNPNSYKPVVAHEKTEIEKMDVMLQEKDFDYTVVKIENESAGMVPLQEAEIVVSGGRGLKGPENWGIVEDLAKILGATTACSRPVADIGWRPHHEHVGQTGITIKPNLYIAIGISGAIQHLAGVNQSKYIIVINKDAEAPFFKAADYGIVGDALEVVPKLTEAIKNFKSSHA